MRIVYLALLVLAPVVIIAQDCLPTSLNIQSSFNSGGPAFLDWDVLDDQGNVLFSGMAQFNASTTSVLADVCLPAGCYQFEASTANDIQPFSVFLGIDADGGFPSTYDLQLNGATMVVDFCLAENGPCTLDAEIVDTGDCWLIAVQVNEFNPNATLVWSINDEPIAVNNANNVLNYAPPAPGSYEICIGYETPDCPFGVFWCETVEVSQECFDQAECPLLFDASVSECEATLYLSGAGVGDVFFYVNGEQISNGEPLVNYTLPFNPSGVTVAYELCAEYLGEGICSGQTWCIDIETSGCVDCGITLDYQENTCGVFDFTANVPSGWQDVTWLLNDELLENQLVWNQTLELEDGLHTVCASFESPTCGYTEACVTVLVDCQQIASCEVAYTIEQVGCGTYEVLFSQTPPNTEVYVFYLGLAELVVDNSVILEVEVTDEYEICIFFESDECPEGNFECEGIELFGCECPTNIVVNRDGCNAEFELEGILSGPGALFSINGNLLGNLSWTTAYEFPTNGSYEVCAVVNSPECESFPVCETVVIDDCVSCTQLLIEVTANPSSVDETLILQTLLNNIAIDADFEVLFFEIEGSVGIGVCLPDGCYEVTGNLPEVLLPELEIELSANGQILLEYTVEANEPIDLVVGINDEDCGTGIDHQTNPGALHLYPVPAYETVTVDLPLSGVEWIEVYDLSGRMVFTENAPFSERLVINVSQFADGLYVLRANTANGALHGRIQVSR